MSSMTVAAVLAFSPVAVAQNARRGGAKEAAPPSGPAPSKDLTGVWRWTGRAPLTVSNETPMFTPVGKAKFDANKPSYGARAVPPATGNDPQGKCDPLGIPRLLFYGGTTMVEFIPAADRMLQFFEWEHIYRTIWTDGRALPKDPDDLTYLGYSTAKWENDTTFVVDSTGFDPRTWVDHFGNPHSDEMTLQERYHRTDRDTIELSLTLTDPLIYSKPWISDTKTFKLQPKAEVKEVFCIPSQEEEFNRRVRNPAGLGNSK